jgi:cell wall-associated NlpC family hydrolase
MPSLKQIGIGAAAVFIAASLITKPAVSAVTHHHHKAPPPAVQVAGISGTPAQVAMVERAISFARDQLRKPYVYGAYGPDSFDCSGLVMEAYLHAGLAGIPRTSEQQWTWGPQVTRGPPQPGDLVFFTGSPIDAPPGHVGLVIGPHLMIEAYATGFPIRVSPFGTPQSAPGDQVVTGVTRPVDRT